MMHEAPGDRAAGASRAARHGRAARSGRAGSIGLSLALAAAIAAPAMAQEQDCSDPQTQLDLNLCAGDALDAANATMEESYQSVLDRLADDPDKQALMRAAQDAWTSYRDAHCAFASSGVEGGSIYPMIWAECLADLAEERTRTIERFLSCEEGDTTCPVPPG